MPSGGAERALGLQRHEKDPGIIPMGWSNGGRRTLAKSRAAGFASTVALLLLPAVASAQVGAETADSGAKGTVGGALLGAELVLVVEALFDVDPWWAYLLGGGLGAVGGGVGGFFVDEQGSAPASMGLLVGGLVLSIPTTVAVLSATSYEPETNPEIEGSPTAQRAPTTKTLLSRPSPSLAMFEDGGFRLGIPGVAIVPVLQPAHFVTSGQEQQRQAKLGLSVTASVLSMSF